MDWHFSGMYAGSHDRYNADAGIADFGNAKRR